MQFIRNTVGAIPPALIPFQRSITIFVLAASPQPAMLCLDDAAEKSIRHRLAPVEGCHWSEPNRYFVQVDRLPWIGKGIVGGAGSVLKGGADAVGSGASGAWNATKAVGQGVWDAGKSVVGGIGTAGKSIASGVGRAASAAWDGAKNVGGAIAGGAKKLFSGW